MSASLADETFKLSNDVDKDVAWEPVAEWEHDFLSGLQEVDVRWCSPTGIVLQHSQDPSLGAAIRSQILSVPVDELLTLSRLLYHRIDPCGDQQDALHLQILKLASVSIQHHLEETKGKEAAPADELGAARPVLQLWLEDSAVLAVIHSIFDDTRTSIASSKKLALDLGFVLASHALAFGDLSLGIRAPLTAAQHQLLLLTGKLLESFMVTTPTHYPFMPAQFFASITWPVVVQDSCHGKVHSLLTFLMSAQLQEASDEIKDEVKHCNYEVVARRQPWKGMFSTMQLLQVVRQVMDSRLILASADCDRKGIASSADCDAVLAVFRNVFQRVAKVDVALLYLDKSQQQAVAHPVQGQCNVCDQAVTSFLGRFNPFPSVNKGTGSAGSVASTETGSSLGGIFSWSSRPKVKRAAPARAGGPVQRHHCRLCFETICADCSAKQQWMQERVCIPCHEVIEEMGVAEVKEKPRRGLFGRKAENEEDVHPELSPEEQQAISILKGEPADYFDDDDDGIHRCCSELIPSSLKDWRDATDDDSSD